MILTIRESHKKEWVKRFMTKEFVTVEQLGKYLTLKLYGYYDTIIERMDNNEVSSEDDYLEGLVDATSMALIKCGIEYHELNDYIELTDAQKWVKV